MNSSPHGVTTARPCAGQMASHQRKSSSAGNRKKQRRARKRRDQQNDFPAEASCKPLVPASTNITHNATTTAVAVNESIAPSPSVPKETESKPCNPPDRCSATQPTDPNDLDYMPKLRRWVRAALDARVAASAAARFAASAAARFAASTAAGAAASAAAAADRAANCITHTTTTAAASNAENLRALPRRELQALAKRFKIKANAKTDTIIDQLVNCEAYALLTPSTCSPRTCAETEREQCHSPKPRRHSTTKSDKPDDNSDDANVKIKNRGANLPAVTHTATTNADVNAAAADASTEPSPSAPKETENKQCDPLDRCSATMPTDADRRYAAILMRNAGKTTNELRHRKTMRGSHPAARRHRKRERLAAAAAAATVAAVASASNEPSPSAPKETENKLCNLPSRCSATALPMTARMNDRVA